MDQRVVNLINMQIKNFCLVARVRASQFENLATRLALVKSIHLIHY